MIPGRARAGSVAAVPVTIDEVLLRGCTLKNSGRIAGLVVYTGAESRIQMNAAKPPRKGGAVLHGNVVHSLAWTVASPACVADSSGAASNAPCASAP